MFNRVKREKTALEKAFDYALLKLDDHDPGSEEYGLRLDRIAQLHKMKEEEKPESVSKDTYVKVAANLVGIFMIIHHEQVNFIASKALPFIDNKIR